MFVLIFVCVRKNKMIKKNKHSKFLAKLLHFKCNVHTKKNKIQTKKIIATNKIGGIGICFITDMLVNW